MHFVLKNDCTIDIVKSDLKKKMYLSRNAYLSTFIKFFGGEIWGCESRQDRTPLSAVINTYYPSKYTANYNQVQ